MKNLTLINNEWEQNIVVGLSEEDRVLLLDNEESKGDAQRLLTERIAAQSLVLASPNDAAEAQSIYDQHKIEGADLIAAEISLPEGTGIINCRVNMEHKQVRF